MWLLPPRGRPELCQATLDACAATGMTSSATLIIDTRAGAYPGIRAAKNWAVLRIPSDMADTMRIVFDLNPDAPFYGWLADDLIPITKGWDKKLEAAAGRWNLADCEDHYLASNKHVDGCPTDLSGAFCWGGDLVRAVGWWALPGVRQAGIDDAWIFISRGLGVRRHCPDVIVEHLNWRTGKRHEDATDNWIRDGVAYVQEDLNLSSAWCHSGDRHAVVDRVADMMRQAAAVE